MLVTALKSAAATDAGRVRRNNEDAYLLDPARGIFLVVDGIGGHAAGEKAAAIAVERIRARLERQTGAPELRIREAIALANNEIFAAARANPEWRGMACVLTLALIENGTSYIGHVGDSRLYLIRRGEIRKVTRDHSPVGEREDAGEIGEAEAMRHPRRSEVFRDVGSEEHAPDDPNFIDIERLPFDAESALLLCSDGLSDQVTSAEIQLAMERHAGNPEAAAQSLVQAANAAGGKDNVTVVIVEGDRFTSSNPAPQAAARRRRGIAMPLLILLALVLAAALVWDRLHPVTRIQTVLPAIRTVGAGAAFETIQAAIDAAQPNDTVDVLPGEYHEAVRMRAGITLRSHTPRAARLMGPPVGDAPAILLQSANAARVAGFLISGDPKAPLAIGISLEQSRDNQIDGVEIENARIGISLRDSNAALSGDAIHDCVEAAVLIDDSSGSSAAPLFSHNSFQRAKTAIVIHGPARPELVGNVFDTAPLELPAGIPLGPIREHNFLLDARPPARPATARKGKEQ
jgi:serine/threonine protein phosphatase PrpC